MKKYLPIIIVILGITVFLLGFNYKNINEPNTFYQESLSKGLLSSLPSTLRESCAKATTGISNSIANVFKEREISKYFLSSIS